MKYIILLLFIVLPIQAQASFNWYLVNTDLEIINTKIKFVDEFNNSDKCGVSNIYLNHNEVTKKEIILSLSDYCGGNEKYAVHEFFHIYCFRKCNYLAKDFPKTISPFGNPKFGVQNIDTDGDDIKERLAFWATKYYFHPNWVKMFYPNIYKILNDYFNI